MCVLVCGCTVHVCVCVYFCVCVCEFVCVCCVWLKLAKWSFPCRVAKFAKFVRLTKVKKLNMQIFFAVAL